MKNTNEDIEEPVKRSGVLLFFGILVLIFFLGIGIYLLVEALQKPKGPEDALNMKQMMVSGVGVFFFSIAILFFLMSMFRTSKVKRNSAKILKKKPVKRKFKRR